MGLQGKVAWITGGGSGIGLAGAVELAKAGAKVVISGRSAATLKEAAKKCDAETIALDVSSKEEVQKAARELVKRHGAVDILVASAGINMPQRNFRNVSLDGWDQIVAVNLSGTSINDEDFLDFVLTRLNNEHVARALCFEITETAAVASLAKATFFMRELKARGCRFALDDFGSGVSSFVYLKTMPVDFLKIDGQFAAHVATDPVDRSMVEAIAKIGRAMQVATIAEKVETEDVLAVLNEIGVDYIQGFHLGEPCAIEDVFH